MKKHNFILFYVLALAFIVPVILAGTMKKDSGIAELDDFLRQRAQNATKAATKAYNPRPELTTVDFNKEVLSDLEGSNSTRRELKRGSCSATNPIDRCWRCKEDWAKDRKALAKCARGFGDGTTGGLDGPIYVVTDPSDDDVVNPKEGTLRFGVIQDDPLWIIFNRSMVIQLKQELMINNDKTIDGRGASVHIAYGAGLTIQFVRNVIIHNLRIHHIVPRSGGFIRDSLAHFGLRTASDGDGIGIFGSSKVWIDHITLDHCHDGLIDAVMATTGVTISNCKFNHHNDVMLLGADDGYIGDEIMQVTIAFNRFGKGLVQRMPRCRWGFFHVVNNDYNKWEMYAIGGSMRPTIISQGNRFRAPDNHAAKEVTHRDYFPEEVWKHWTWRSKDDYFLNGAFFKESGKDLDVDDDRKQHMVQAKGGIAVGRLTRYAGAIKCRTRGPC